MKIPFCIWWIVWFHKRTFLSISPLTLAVSGPCPGWSWPPAACTTPLCLPSPSASCSATSWTIPPRNTISWPQHPPSRWTAPNYRKWKLLPACGTSGLPPAHWSKQFDLWILLVGTTLLERRWLKIVYFGRSSSSAFALVAICVRPHTVAKSIKLGFVQQKHVVASFTTNTSDAKVAICDIS